MRGVRRVMLILALADSQFAYAQVEGDTYMNASRSVLTHHNDVERTGSYLYEQILTPEVVRARGLRLARRFPLDAMVGTQLLYIHQLKVNGRSRDVVYAVTSANTVHAVDVRDGSVLWTSTLRDQEDTARHLPRGPVSTPVIDSLTGTMFIVYSTKTRPIRGGSADSRSEKSSGSQLDAAFWLVTMDVRNGRKLRATKIAATTRRPDGSLLTFLPENHWNRPALLLTNNSLYVAFGPRRREELIEYHGWVMRYDARTLEQRGVFCTSPAATGGSPSANVGQGAGIWQSGAGLAADARGNVYAMTGNARADPAQGWFGNTFVKLKPHALGGISAAGAYTPEEQSRRLEKYDLDLGSGGPLLIPGTTLLAGGGKTGTAYLIDTRTMQLRQSFIAATSSDPDLLRDAGQPVTWNYGPQLHGSLTYWRGPHSLYSYIYVWGAEDFLRAYRFQWTTQSIDTVAAAVGEVLVPSGYPYSSIYGGMLSLTAQGTTRGTGILWSTLLTTRRGFRLSAFDAQTLKELWSTPLPSLSYMQPPTVAAGVVMVSTTSDAPPGLPEIRIYELNQESR
jgi:outer membrane protein assembly factor BamB